MLSKALTITSVAALAGQSLAFNAHRRLHQNDKRVVEIAYETIYTTVTVTDDCTTSPTAAGPAAAQQTTTHGVVKHLSSALSDSPLASVPTVSLPSPSQASSSSPAPQPTHSTTMVTVVHSSAPAPIYYYSSSSSSSTTAAPAPPPTSSAAPAPPTSSAPPTSAAPPPSSSAPSSSSTSEAASTPTPLGKSVAEGVTKRGMAYNNGPLANTFGSQCSECSWAYNWGYDPSGLDPKYSYIPQLWSSTPEHTNGWQAAVSQAKANGATKVFSFNEPDIASQANLSPADAAAAHAQWLNPLAGQMRIGAPAVSNSGDPNQGAGWLGQFMSACAAQAGGCAIDFCVTHWYSGAQWIDTLFDQLDKVHTACGGKPVMLTEFAPSGSDEEIAEFMKNVIPRLEAVPYLEGYSYFMVNEGSLMSDANTPSSYGQLYATL